MFASRLFWKILAVYVALTVVVGLSFLALLSQRQRASVTRDLERQLTNSALILRSEMADVFRGGTGSDDVQSRVKALEAELGTRITLIAGDGTVLGDSSEDPTIMERHDHRPEIRMARERGKGIAQRTSETTGVPMMYVAVRAGNQSAPLGFIRTALPMSSVQAEVASMQRVILVTSLVGGLTGLVAMMIVVAAITRPLEMVTRAVSQLAEGDLEQSVVIPNRDEFGLLAQAVNQMSTAIAHRFEDLRRRSRQLEETGERLSTVLGGMIEGVVAVDDRERILFANKAARFMLELAGSNVIGRPIWEVVRNPTVQEVVRTALDGTTHRSVEFELPRTQSVVALLATRLPGDPCPGVVLVLHDVTELRRLENLRREFVSNVSHELKTPLTSIQAYTETLLNGAIDDPTHNREFLRRIEDQADRLHKLILDLLRLARIESGKDVFEVTAVPLGGVIHACVEQHATIADSKGVTLTVDAPGERIRVHADAEGLRTIMDNLIDNAIKYTPQGGSVTVRWWAEGSMAVIEVEDTGIGIAKMHQTRIFERFYRADKARSREFGGTGLGLSIVKHLTQVFEGTIDVESEPGKGSTFTVRLPRV